MCVPDGGESESQGLKSELLDQVLGRATEFWMDPALLWPRKLARATMSASPRWRAVPGVHVRGIRPTVAWQIRLLGWLGYRSWTGKPGSGGKQRQRCARSWMAGGVMVEVGGACSSPGGRPGPTGAVADQPEVEESLLGRGLPIWAWGAREGDYMGGGGTDRGLRRQRGRVSTPGLVLGLAGPQLLPVRTRAGP